jgi:hypothetical protein
MVAVKKGQNGVAARPNSEAHTPPVQPENAEFKPLGNGYEHLVYQHIHHPKSVVKISAHKLRQILTAFPGSIRPRNSALANYGRAEFAPDIRGKNAEIGHLSRAFGSVYVLRERRFLAPVKVSASFISQLFSLDYWQRGAPDWVGNCEVLWTHVAVQRFCNAASDPNRLSFSFGSFTEDGPFDRVLYRQLHALMVQKSPAAIPLDAFLGLQDNSSHRHLSKLLRATERDCELKSALVDFVSKSMTYARRSGNILALAGQDNVFFFRSAGRWTYRLMDVLPIPMGPVLHQAEEVALRASRCAPSKQDLEAVKRALNFVRTINGFASALGLEERIGLSPALAAASEIDLAPDGRYAF